MAGKRDGGKDFVYGRRPVAEAQRGRRRVRRVWTTDDLPPGELSRLAGSPDHQGIVAEVDPYPYADPRALLERPDALVVALDQIQDPRNLGAVCRSAEAVGAAGCGDPVAEVRVGDRGRVQGLGGSGRAPADRKGHEPGRLARLCQGGRGLGLRGGSPEPRRRTRAPTSPGRWCWCWGARGEACAGGWPRAATCSFRSRSRGHVDSLNVSAAAAVLLFETARQRAGGNP